MTTGKVKFKMGDTFNFVYFGDLAPVTITEMRGNETVVEFFCQWDGAYGGMWMRAEQIESELESAKTLRQQKSVERFNYHRNGGANGPTGHGHDICFSDADPGL